MRLVFGPGQGGISGKQGHGPTFPSHIALTLASGAGYTFLLSGPLQRPACVLAVPDHEAA
jgi:hypothetical protein